MIVPAVLLPSMVGMLLGIAPTRFDPAAGFADGVDRAAGVIRFRRVLAPEDRMKDWPLGGERYLPMDAAEFQRLVDALKPREGKGPAAPSASIVSARYSARLDGERLVGSAALEVVLARSGPAMLTLEPCNLAIGRARWRSASDDPEAALLGLGSDGKLAVLVERSGRLELDWSLAAGRDSGHVSCFSFEAPPAAANRLLVELPKDCAPSVDRGMIFDSEPADERSRRWRIELARLARFHLHVVPAGAEVGRPLALLRESRTYDCSPRGLEVSAQWKLRVHNEPLERVTLLLDPGLRLVSARLGESAIPWSAAPAANGGPTRVELRLPEPIRDVERVIRLGAIGPVALDRRWRLPRIRCQGLLWQEGGVALLVPEPLVAERVEPLWCVQTGAGPLSAPRVGRSAQFQCFDPDATIEVLVTRCPVSLRMLGVAEIELGSDAAAARMAAEFHVTGGSLPAIEADLSPRWTIDLIESVPAGDVADWTIEPRPDGRGRLAVRFAGPLGPQRPVRLEIAARRPFSPSTDKLRSDDLPPLRFRGLADGRRLVAVRPVGCNALELTGDERLNRLAADDLGPSELALFAEPPGDLLFEHNARLKSLDVSLVPQAARYAGAIRVAAEVGNRLVRETCLLRCVPEAGRVERVLVRLAPGRPTPPSWTLDGRDGRFSARRWSDQEQAAAGVDRSIETWELTFRRPRDVPFEIAAVREAAIKPRPSVAPHKAATVGRAQGGTQGGTSLSVAKGVDFQPTTPFATLKGVPPDAPHNATDGRGFLPVTLTLASLPEAATQQGVLVVRRLGGGDVFIDNNRLRAILPEPPPPGRVQTVRGVYRYDPIEEVDGRSGAAVRVSKTDRPDVASAWVWNLRLESWRQPGAARHLATYELQNSGRRRLELTLPPGTGRENLRGVWIGGEKVACQVVERGRRRLLSVEIPADRKYPRVAIEWTTAQPRLGIVGTLSAAPPEPDLPVLARNWTVWLPPGYECVDPRAGESSAAAAQGWTAWRMDFSAEAPPTLKFVRRASMRLFAAVMFLLVAAAGCWMFGGPTVRGVRGPLAALGLFAAAAALLPGEYVPLACGGALGALCCLAWRWIRPPTRVPQPLQRASADGAGILPDGRTQSDSTVSTASPLGLLFLAAFLGCGVAQGADGPEGVEGGAIHYFVGATGGSSTRVFRTAGQASSGTRGTPIYRVFVPIDAQRKPTGGKVYVPEPFYQELHRHAAASAEKPPPWMILGATYRGDLSREGAAGRLTAGTLHARYDLRVFEPGARVRLPLCTEGATFLSGSALLDGRPIEPRREPDAAALVVEVPDPGRYRLELSLRPTMRNDGASGGFDLSIPRVPAARLELTLPDGAPSVEVPSARGGVQVRDVREGPRLLSADLGPADRLTVRWQEEMAPGGARAAVEVEQLAWLKVQPGSVLIAVKFKFRSVEGRIQQVRLAVDPRLRLLPLSGVDPPTAHVAAESGHVRLITFRWPRPISRQATLEATLLLGGASGVGNVPLPKIEPLDFQPVGNWMAVSVDPALEHELKQNEPLESVAVADFLRAWGDADSTPQAAFRLPEGQAGWTLSTRPRQPRGAVDQNLTLSFDEDHVNVLFEASLSIASGYVFQHRLSAPKGLKVESLSVLEEDIERVQRWSQDDDGTITIFLGGPASGTQKLAVRGRLPVHIGRQWPLPPMRVERCVLRSATIRLFRRPNVLLEVQGEEGEQLILDDISPAAPDSVETTRPFDPGRLLRTIRWDGTGQPPAAVILRPNRPKLSAEQVVRLQDDGHRWSARIELRLTVSGGLLDEIRVRAPAPWNGPYEADRPGELQVRQLPGEGRCLVFRPREAISADFALAVSGPLELAPGDRFSAPDLRLLGIDELKRWIVLPGRSGNRTYHWRTRGLKKIDLPDNWNKTVMPHLHSSYSSYLSYQVSTHQYLAILESVAVAGGSGSIRLADVALACRSDGRLRGAAVLEVEPGGVAQRTLRLPEGCELVHVLVEGMPALPRRIGGKNLWRLALASADAPQRVEVVYCGLLPETARTGRVRFDAPTLGEMPVRRTRWTIGVPAGWVVSDPPGAAAAGPWKPADVLRRAIGGSQRSVHQYESADGGATLSLDCRPARPDRPRRYLAATVALAALGLLALSVLPRRGRKM